MQDELAGWRPGSGRGPAAGAAPSIDAMAREELRGYKRAGFSDRQIATLADVSEHDVHVRRRELGVQPVVKLVDTCAA